jgi:transposase
MEIGVENSNIYNKNINILLPYIFAENTELKQKLVAAEDKIKFFIEQIRLGRQRQFGKKSEKVHEQLEMVFDDVEAPLPETAKDLATETITYTRQKKTVGRRIDTSNLPREQIMHDLSEAEKKCETCGKDLQQIGEDRSEQLEYIPSQLKVIEHITPKYTCRCCETIKTADKPESPLPKSMAGASLIADVIIKKYEHHLPWYRQSKILAQEGIDIPANTIGNWFMQAGEILKPLKEAAWVQINHTNVLQADETTVKVLEDNIKGYMWCYHSCIPQNRFVLFEYNDSRSGQVVNNTLENYQGILQTDGYSGYNNMRVKEGVTNLGCFAHCRRKFVEVTKVAAKTGAAHEIVGLIGKLYGIEEKARTEKLSFIARKELRQQKAKPILEKIHARLIQARPPPQSAFCKAITYAINQWSYLIRYADYGEAEIDNNWAENQIRPFALGRRNWLFAGNKSAAETAAFFYGLIQTCKLNNINSRKYLNYVLSKVGQMRRGEIAPQSLLPQFIDKNLLS